MDADIINNIITGGVTLIVGAIGARYAYKGALDGAKMQIDSQQEQAREQLENEQEQAREQLQREQQRLLNEGLKQIKFTRKAIESFISIEIKSNFMKLNSSSFSARLTENDMPFQTGIPYTYKYDEYNSLKYELIKFESDEVKEIINIYEMFYLIERKQDVITFTQAEYDEFKKAYNVCLSKYL